MTPESTNETDKQGLELPQLPLYQTAQQFILDENEELFETSHFPRTADLGIFWGEL